MYSKKIKKNKERKNRRNRKYKVNKNSNRRISKNKQHGGELTASQREKLQKDQALIRRELSEKNNLLKQGAPSQFANKIRKEIEELELEIHYINRALEENNYSIYDQFAEDKMNELLLRADKAPSDKPSRPLPSQIKPKQVSTQKTEDIIKKKNEEMKIMEKIRGDTIRDMQLLLEKKNKGIPLSEEEKKKIPLLQNRFNAIRFGIETNNYEAYLNMMLPKTQQDVYREASQLVGVSATSSAKKASSLFRPSQSPLQPEIKEQTEEKNEPQKSVEPTKETAAAKAKEETAKAKVESIPTGIVLPPSTQSNVSPRSAFSTTYTSRPLPSFEELIPIRPSSTMSSASSASSTSSASSPYVKSVNLNDYKNELELFGLRDLNISRRELSQIYLNKIRAYNDRMAGMQGKRPSVDELREITKNITKLEDAKKKLEKLL